MDEIKPVTGKKRGRKPGVPNKLTTDIKRSIEYAFNHVNGHNNRWLIDMANGDKDDKKLFVALLSRIVPAQVAVSVQHTIDLSDAMLAADANIKRLEKEYEQKALRLSSNSKTPVIDNATISLYNKDLD